MKKGIIDTIMIGFLLLSGIIIFIATVSDDLVVKNKLMNLKTVTDNTSLALAKHYIENENIENAEEVATNLLFNNELGTEVSDSITYTWDLISTPKTVTVTIPSYSQPTFWYKIIGKDSFELINVESKAEIVSVDPISTETITLAPLAINNCGREDDGDADNDLTLGNEIEFTFTTSDEFDNDDMYTFYGVDKDCSFPAGNSNFAHFKNLFAGGEVEYADYDIDDVDEDTEICLVETSFENPFTVDPMLLYNKLRDFPADYKMDILMFECESVSSLNMAENDLIVENILSIELAEVYSLTSETDDEGVTRNNLTIRAKIVSSSETVILKY